MLDFKLIFFYILPRLFLNTLVSGIICLIVGSAVGLVVGLLRRRVKETLFVSCISAFFGCLVVFITPWLAAPHSLQSWGNSGGLGSLQVLVELFFVLIGGFAVCAIASIFCFRQCLALKKKLAITILACTYVLQFISLYYHYLYWCNKGIFSYCTF